MKLTFPHERDISNKNQALEHLPESTCFLTIFIIFSSCYHKY
jgi:hypothetical protein